MERPPQGWLDKYPPLQAISDAAWTKIAATARCVRLPQGATVFREGDACNHYTLVIDGSLRVEKTTADGHDIVLYHVRPGQTCEITTCCLLSGNHLTAHATAETPLTAARISAGNFHSALEESPQFRHFIYRSIDKGLVDLIGVIEQVAFVPTHERLASHLLSAMATEHPLKVTHQTLANEMGTAREVVSRLLKEFERHGWVRLRRGEIAILNTARLHDIGSKPTV